MLLGYSKVDRSLCKKYSKLRTEDLFAKLEDCVKRGQGKLLFCIFTVCLRARLLEIISENKLFI